KLDSEQATYKPEQVDVNERLQRVVEHVFPLAHEKEITVTINTKQKYFIWVDKEKLVRALLNITNNGIRHAKSEVTLTLNARKQFVYIEVRDDGEGIDEQLLPHVFHRFMKGQHGETGLGLAIARAIVEQSGGTLEAHSHAGEGATFILKFPQKMH